jgi:hypothetical protein
MSGQAHCALAHWGKKASIIHSMLQVNIFIKVSLKLILNTCSTGMENAYVMPGNE